QLLSEARAAVAAGDLPRALEALDQALPQLVRQGDSAGLDEVRWLAEDIAATSDGNLADDALWLADEATRLRTEPATRRAWSLQQRPTEPVAAQPPSPPPPVSQSAQREAYAPAPPPPAPPKPGSSSTPSFARSLPWLVAAAAVLVAVVIAVGSGGGKKDPRPAPRATPAAPPTTSAAAPTPAPPPPPPTVALKLSDDVGTTVEQPTIVLHGRVTPGTKVRVDGDRAGVQGRNWT